MNREEKRFIKILEEIQGNISDMISETTDGLEKEFSNKDFNILTVGMTVMDGFGVSGVILEIDGPHAITVQYQGRKKVHCMDGSCFHYEPIHPVKIN